MRFQIRDLLISDVADPRGIPDPCGPDTVCGTITNTGPSGHTCTDGTHCCWTQCTTTSVPTLAQVPQLNDDFVAMLRKDVASFKPETAAEPTDKKDLAMVEKKLSDALEEVRRRLKAT